MNAEINNNKHASSVHSAPRNPYLTSNFLAQVEPFDLLMRAAILYFTTLKMPTPHKNGLKPYLKLLLEASLQPSCRKNTKTWFRSQTNQT